LSLLVPKLGRGDFRRCGVCDDAAFAPNEKRNYFIFDFFPFSPSTTTTSSHQNDLEFGWVGDVGSSHEATAGKISGVRRRSSGDKD